MSQPVADDDKIPVALNLINCHRSAKLTSYNRSQN